MPFHLNSYIFRCVYSFGGPAKKAMDSVPDKLIFRAVPELVRAAIQRQRDPSEGASCYLHTFPLAACSLSPHRVAKIAVLLSYLPTPVFSHAYFPTEQRMVFASGALTRRGECVKCTDIHTRCFPSAQSKAHALPLFFRCIRYSCKIFISRLTCCYFYPAIK